MLNSNEGVRGSRGGKSLNSCVVKALVLLSLPSLPTHLLPSLPFSHSLSVDFLGSLPKRETSFCESKFKWGNLGNV